MLITLLGFLLLAAAHSANGTPRVFFNNVTELEVHMTDIISIPFTIKDLNHESLQVNIKPVSSDENIVIVKTPEFDPDLVHKGIYESKVNISGIFLGNADVHILVDSNGVSVVLTNFQFTKLNFNFSNLLSFFKFHN